MQLKIELSVVQSQATAFDHRLVKTSKEQKNPSIMAFNALNQVSRPL